MYDNKYWEQRVDESSPERENDVRSAWDRDYSRIIHSAAFRRMQSKTQVLGLGESDFYRTRLTHSLEVAQISESIVLCLMKKSTISELKTILPDKKLIAGIGLAHDLGHPPFGHGGEVALNYCMRKHNGFEANGQTLRILTKLEKYSERFGLNPTRRLLLGVLKYPIAYSEIVGTKINAPEESRASWLFKSDDYKPPKCYLDGESKIVDWILEKLSESDKTLLSALSAPKDADSYAKTKFKSLDASIMEVADDISYSIHDFEDAVALKLITREIFDKFISDEKIPYQNIFNECGIEDYDGMLSDIFSGKAAKRKNRIGELVHCLVSKVEHFEQIDTDTDARFENILLKYEVKLKKEYEKLRKVFSEIVHSIVIKDENVQLLEFKGQKVVCELFEVYQSDPMRFLPKSFKKSYEIKTSDADRNRVICDYIAGMTDEYATKAHERIFSVRKGSVFDRL